MQFFSPVVFILFDLAPDLYFHEYTIRERQLAENVLQLDVRHVLSVKGKKRHSWESPQ